MSANRKDLKNGTQVHSIQDPSTTTQLTKTEMIQNTRKYTKKCITQQGKNRSDELTYVVTLSCANPNDIPTGKEPPSLPACSPTANYHRLPALGTMREIFSSLLDLDTF